MNDPNGTILHGGWYHLFFQHDPDRDTWGRMHWGHARSRDLVHWQLLPLALVPAKELGEDHCFSGSAWRDAAGRVLLFYSSVEGDHDGFRTAQWAVRAGGELDEFRRVEANPVVRPADEGDARLGPTARDPFVFERSGRTFMVLGADLPDEDGAPVIPLYEAAAPDLLRWRYRGFMYRPPAGERRFLECPNLLRVGDADVLLLSPHGPVEYRIGRFDADSGSFEADRGGRLDESMDFYATSTFALEENPEPAVVGWVRGWSAGRGWNGALSLPRRLSIGPDGALLQRPEPALRQLRGAAAEMHGCVVAPGEPVSGGPPPTASLELEAVLRPGDGDAGLRLVGPDGSAVLELRIDAVGGSAELAGQSFDLPDAPDGRRSLRLFWDRSVAELFVDDGRRVCTRVIDEADGAPLNVEWFARGAPFEVVRAAVWPLAPIW